MSSTSGKGFRIAGTVLRVFFGALVAFVCGLVLFRIFSSSDPKSIRKIQPTDAVADAYEAGTLGAFRQDQRTITSAEYNYGYFSVTDCVFLPGADEIQLVFRYNTSTIRSTAEDYALPEVPPRDADLYDVSVVIAIDLTPEDDTDNDSNDPASVKFVRLPAVCVRKAQKTVYQYGRYYIKVAGEDFSLSQLLEDGTLNAVYCDIYYNGAIDYDSPAYGTLCLYDYAGERKPVKWKSADKKAIREYIENRKSRDTVSTEA